MLKTTLLASSALAALLLCAACGPQNNPQAQQQSTDNQATTAPTAVERTAAEAKNEVEQVVASTTQISPAELAAGSNATDVSSPATTLSTASVKTSSGETIGEVRSVAVGPDGKAQAVNIEVGGFLNVGERVVSIEAKKFTYLKDRNILVTALAKSDIEKFPPVVEH